MLREEAHVFDVAGREALDVRECGFEVGGDSGNDLGASSLLGLALQNVTPNAMVEAHDLGIHALRAPGGVGGHRHAATEDLDAGISSLETFGNFFDS